MRCSTSALLLAVFAAGEALAGPFKHSHSHSHSHFHAKKEISPVDTEASPSKGTKGCSEAHAARLMDDLGFKSLGVNAESSEAGVWIGDDGPYTVTYHNEADEDITLVIWGPWGSWVNVHTPLITSTIDKATNLTISFASGQTGAWSAVYEDTEMLNGQISNTWGEYTFGPTGVVDVSREPNMNGKAMSIVGPTCTSDMERCVFVCKEGTVCMTNYELQNCGPESQPFAQYGYHDGAPTGGCGGLGDGAQVDAYLM